MFEGVGAYLINYYLGEFLEDINNDQLSGDLHLSEYLFFNKLIFSSTDFRRN